MEWLTTYQCGTNTKTLKPDHYQPCLNILCANYNNKHKPVQPKVYHFLIVVQ